MSIQRPAVLAVLAAALVALPAPAQDAPLPETFTATMIPMNVPGSGIVQVRLTIERWTTAEERQALAVALQQGGTDQLVRAMEDLTLGYVQLDQSLRWPIRTAATWRTDKGRAVRVATNRPVMMAESMRGTRSLDYPIGIIEFTLPDQGKGEGTLLAAAQVRFDDQGRIEVTSMPQNTGPQRLSNVKLEVPKPKKDKPKKDASKD
jgi:hypothetical protein